MRINDENKSVDMEQRDINFTLPPYIRNYQFLNKNELPDKIIFPMFQSVNIQGADGKMHLIAIEYIAPDSSVAVEIAEDGADIPEITPAQEVVLDNKDEEIKRLKEEVAALTPTGEGGEDEVGGTAESEALTCARCKGPLEEIDSNICGTCADDLRADVDAKAAELALTPAPEDFIRQQEEYEAEHGDSPRRPEGSSSPARSAFAESVGESVHQAEKEKYKAEDEKITKMAETVRVPKQPPGGDIGPGQPLSDTHPRDARDQAMTAKALQPEAEIKEEEEKPFEKEIKRDATGKPIIEDKPDE